MASSFVCDKILDLASFFVESLAGTMTDKICSGVVPYPTKMFFNFSTALFSQLFSKIKQKMLRKLIKFHSKNVRKKHALFSELILQFHDKIHFSDGFFACKSFFLYLFVIFSIFSGKSDTFFTFYLHLFLPSKL